MLETAILKVFSTEALWQGVYETLQVYGGQGYFTDEPYERMMRDARHQHDRRGGQRSPAGLHRRGGHARRRPGTEVDPRGPEAATSFLPTLWSFSREHMGRMVQLPSCRCATPMLRPLAASLARRVARFAWSVERVLMTHREAVLRRQLVLERIAWAAIALSPRPAPWPALTPSSPPRSAAPATARRPNSTFAWHSAAATSRSAP